MVGSNAIAMAVAAGQQPHQQLNDDDNPCVQVQQLQHCAFAVEEPPADEEAAAERQADVARLLAGFRQHLHDRTAHHLGYPYNLNLNLNNLEDLQFHNLCINNLGDPFIESNYGVHSRPLEVAVLDWFARLWDLQKDQYWGYITSCGTEGNLHGLLVALP